ncbi:hypothetical protein KVH22_25125 [Streptomyces olivaceus]|uniref:hypothetical protein n=1 Tax=Streptomyces olivaceus TaxID=47716 RepID=UPI001CCC984D|nr:hypothetical protein [Streptomyces olivaceus]MBZ6258800.1 hypothetical protein [Streptomyces olivaceus]
MHDENADRFALIDGELLLRLMKCPDRGGQRHTVRTLAEAAGIGRTKVSKMTRGESVRPLTAAQATNMARAVGIRRKAIFTHILSVSADTDKEE